MLRIIQFLACLAVLNQVNCFFNPLSSLLFDSPAILPFGEVLEESKMLAAVNQMGGGDLEDVLLAPFGQVQVQVPEQQTQQQQQLQSQQRQQEQQQLTRKQQRKQQQQLEQQRQQELEREQERKRQQEQEQRIQQQQQQREQQQKQREQRRQQKEQQLKQDQQKIEQQLQQQQQIQQQQQQLQQQQLKQQQQVEQQPRQQQIKQYDQLQVQVLGQDGQERMELLERLDGRLSENEEIVHDFADLKQRMDYIRDKIVRTIQVAKSQIEDHQRQADKQIQTLVLEQQRLQQQIRLLEQQREQQQQIQQLQQLQLPEQQQEDMMMLRARSPLSRLSDELIMPRRMFQTDRVLDAMMPMPIVTMKIDTIDQISPLSLLNQISNSIMQNPLLPFSKPSEAQSCDQVHGKAMDAQRENRIRIQNTLIKQMTYRFESSTCQCQQQQQQLQQQQQQQQQLQPTLEHCSLAYSRPDQQTCKLSELNNRQQAYTSNCEALEACRAQGAQCDGVYHDGAKYYLIECKQQGQRIATRPGLGAEYIIQLRSCF